MRIYINGEALDVSETATVESLLERIGQTGRRVAIECNGEIVPRSMHAERTLEPDDRIEIVQAIGGG